MKIVSLSKHMHLWDEVIALYEESFEASEREDTQIILERVRSGVYEFLLCVKEEKVIGFAIVDTNRTLNYSIVTFLAIKKEYQREGRGRVLSHYIVKHFLQTSPCFWLLIEAEDRQSKLYESVGFERLALKYRIPAFNSSASEEMNLLLVSRDKEIDKESLLAIVSDIFLRGYGVQRDDKRLLSQLEQIKECY